MELSRLMITSRIFRLILIPLLAKSCHSLSTDYQRYYDQFYESYSNEELEIHSSSPVHNRGVNPKCANITRSEASISIIEECKCHRAVV